MIRGTTAQFKFKLPYRNDDLLWATIKFWQLCNTGTTDAPLPITKTLSHCSTSDDDRKELCVSLTAEETTRFSEKSKARVQIRAQHINGTVIASRQQLITVYPINDDIVDDDVVSPGAEEQNGLIIFDGGAITE